MTKRRPFGSRDPNVQRSGDSVASSVPSVEEALRLKRKKKKNKTLTLENDGSFLIDSTSKTPRISNRSKQLPPRRGTTKQLRRLEQSMASRAQQERQQQRPRLSSEVAVTTTTNRQDSTATKRTESKTTGVKRKEQSGDNVVSKKKLRQPVEDVAAIGVDGSEPNHGAKKILDGAEVTVVRKGQDNTNIQKKTQLREASVGTKKQNQHREESVAKKRIGRNVAADYLHKHRDSNKKSMSPKLLATDELSTLRRPERLETPMDHDKNVELKRPVTEEATMDCTSDDESLHLSPDSSATSPVQDKVEEDPAWVLKPPTEQRRQKRVPPVETEETELVNDRLPRLSMTTHAEGVTPVRTPSLANESSVNLPRSMEELLHRESGDPIVTKGMLSRARQAKADNEDVVAAMMKSGPPYKGRQERSPTPDASMVGTMIGIHPLERSDSVDGSEVTMLTNDSYLNDFHGEQTSKKSSPKSEDESEDSSHVDRKKVDRRASPDDVSAVPEASSASRSSKKRDRRSRGSQRVSSIREPEEGVDEGNQVIYFEHNGTMIPHPPLPSGWIIRMSQSKQRPFYCHPDHGSTWHCPVVLPRSSSESILNTVYQPAEQKENEKASDDDDTESEDSEMWSHGRQRKSDAGSVLERQSQTSLTSANSARHSVGTMNSAAKAEVVEVTKDHGSEVSSLASSVVDKGERTTTNEGEVEEPRASPGVPAVASPEMPPNKRAFEATEERGSEARSQASAGSGTPRSTFEPKVADPAAETFGLDDSSPNQGAARVSLVETEATTEELSPMFVEEIVSTAQFRRSNAGAVAVQDMHADDNDEELVQTGGSPNKAKEPFEVHGKESDEAFLALLRETHTDTGSLAFVAQNGERSKVHSPHSPSTNAAEPVTEEIAHVGADGFDGHDDDIIEPTEDEPVKEDTQSIDSKLGRGDDDGLFPTSEHSDSAESQPAGAVETEETVQHTLSHRTGDADFETEVDDVVFGVDHDDIDLSPQAKRLSPIKHINSFDNGGDTLPTESTLELEDEEVVMDKLAGIRSPTKSDSPIGLDDSFDSGDESPPTKNTLKSDDDAATETPARVSASTKNNSPFDHQDDSFDHRSVEAEDLEASHQDHHDDQLSVESSFMGTVTVKWRGYSHRILHPPHPLESLLNLDALIQAALRRMERRKKAKSKKKSSQKKKSTRRERRTASTKLVFE